MPARIGTKASSVVLKLSRAVLCVVIVAPGAVVDDSTIPDS
jgi:hypothetical protein